MYSVSWPASSPSGSLPARHPTVYQSILDHPDREKYDISTLRFAVTVGADIPVELIRRIAARSPFRSIVTGYGLTEAARSRPRSG